MRNMKDKISIIMAAFNAENYISEAIESVIKQTHTNWELLIVNDGSDDNTQSKIDFYQDPRITSFKQKNMGVSTARNIGLEHMKGDYFCFLDSDDVFPENSLSSRLQVFKDCPEIDFVDGAVQYVDHHLKQIDKFYRPSFNGEPFNSLLRLSNKCLFGNTWMIKQDTKQTYCFNTDMTHAEDLFFYLSIAQNKKYKYTEETILHYRQRPGSAMTDLHGLETGYIHLIKNVRKILHRPTKEIILLKIISSKIMFLSYLIDGRKIVAAIKSPFKILFA